MGVAALQILRLRLLLSGAVILNTGNSADYYYYARNIPNDEQLHHDPLMRSSSTLSSFGWVDET